MRLAFTGCPRVRPPRIAIRGEHFTGPLHLLMALLFLPMIGFLLSPKNVSDTARHAIVSVFGDVTGGVAASPYDGAFARERAMSAHQLMSRWDSLIGEAAQRVGVSAAWIRAVMRQESGGRTVLADDMPITSRAGAVGIMQLEPGTYAEMRAQLKLGADPYNPRDNVYAGAAYLKWLHRKYGYPGMFAAYNGGPGTYEDHIERGKPLPAETVNYMASVTAMLEPGARRAAWVGVPL